MTYDVQQGFHKGTLVSCILIAIFWSMFGVMIMPNTPFLIRLYIPVVSAEDIGTYTGIFTAAYFVGMIPGAIIWGRLADSFGRRPIMALTLIFNVICMAALGFSSSFSLSVFVRFLHGLLDGVLPIVKTIVSEISNEKNIALGTSSVFVGTSFGGLVGPIICGYFSNPDHISFLKPYFPVFIDQPFLLPILISATCMLLCTVVFLCCAIETLTEEERAHIKKLRDGLKKGFSGILRKSISKRDLEEQLLVAFNEQSSPRYLFQQRDFLMMVILEGAISFIQMAFDTILPVALAAPINLGGLALDADAVNIVVGISSPFQLFLILLSPILSRFALYRTQFGWEIFLFSLLAFVAPFVFKLGDADPMLMGTILMAYIALLSVIRALCLNTAIVLFANMSFKEVRGLIMGISQTVGGVCRFLGPLFIPILYSWTCKPHQWINSSFCFYLLGICGMLSSIFAIWVSDNTNSPKGSLKDG